MSDINAAILASYTQANFVGNCCTVSVAALLLYEYSITISSELRWIWRKDSCLKLPFVVFILNRLVMLGLAVTYILSVILPLDTVESCEGVNVALYIFELLLYIIWPVLSALRVHALSGRNWVLSLLTLAMGLVPAGLNLFNWARTSFTMVELFPSGPMACDVFTNISPSLGTKLEPTTRAFAMAADFMVLVVTCHHTRGQYRHLLEIGRRLSLPMLLLRDGFVYFLLFMLLAAVNVVLVNVHANDNLDVGIVFIAPLTSIIVSRFFLNLQEVGQSSHVYLGPETGMEASSGDTTESQDAHEMTTVGFADGTQIGARSTWKTVRCISSHLA